LNKIPGFMPVWATSNYSEVTEFWNGTDKISDKYDDIVAGSRKSDCLLPCTTTDIKTVYMNEKYVDRIYANSRIDITFSTTVNRYIYDFPKFNFTSFLASLGGTTGLWLGLGVIQLLESTIVLFESFKRKINNKM